MNQLEASTFRVQFDKQSFSLYTVTLSLFRASAHMSFKSQISDEL